jgi:hypothetical protein
MLLLADSVFNDYLSLIIPSSKRVFFYLDRLVLFRSLCHSRNHSSVVSPMLLNAGGVPDYCHVRTIYSFDPLKLSVPEQLVP